MDENLRLENNPEATDDIQLVPASPFDACDELSEERQIMKELADRFCRLERNLAAKADMLDEDFDLGDGFDLDGWLNSEGWAMTTSGDWYEQEIGG